MRAARIGVGGAGGAAERSGVSQTRLPNKEALREALAFYTRWAGPYTGTLLLALLCSLPVIALAGALPWVLRKVSSLVSAGSALETIVLWLLLGFATVISSSLLEALSKYLVTTVYVHIVTDLRNALFRSVQREALDAHLRSSAGEVASLITNDSQFAAGGVIELYTNLWLNPLLMLFLIGVMFYYNPAVAAIMLLTLPLVAAATAITSRKARKAEAGFLSAQGALLGDIHESLVNIKQVKSFSLEEGRNDQIKQRGEELIALRKRTVMLKSLMGPLVEVIALAALLVMVVVAYFQYKSGTTTMPDVVACLAAAMGLTKPVKSISGSLVEIQRSLAAVSRVSWALARFPGDMGAEAGGVTLASPINTIEFKGVSFSYDGRTRVLDNIDLKVSKGDRICIYGPSGSGKTTLIDLLAGFYPPGSGELLINGEPASRLSTGSYLGQIGIVTQSPFLFNTNLRENMQAVAAGASDEAIWEALRKAGCETMMTRFDRGLDTVVGERGEVMSGGQRKRIALARALLRPISVLVLDEVTSELDPESEARVLETIDSLSSGMIILHVSHRESVLRHSTRSFALRHGRLEEIRG